MSAEQHNQVKSAADTTRDATAYEVTHPGGAAGKPADWPALSGYEVTAELARGGMGRVFAGRDLTLGRDVAIKTLLPGAEPKRFVTEAKITARLPHPGIPPVHALGTLPDGAPYLVMKLIRGRTLAALLKERPTVAADRPRLVQVFDQVAQAVGFAHAQGIVHRDLKPLNVMVGAFGEVQVMDWGLAKVLADREQVRPGHATGKSAAAQTQAGTILGTPGYMAPEQARGEIVDARADVFALGSILTAILTGRPAFVGSTARETIGKAAAADLAEALVCLDASGADAELIALARRCLAARAADRPADASAVAEEVAAYRAGVESRLRQAEAQRAAALVREAEQRKRRRHSLVLSAVIVMVLLGGIAGTTLGMLSARDEAKLKEQARANEKLRADGEAAAKTEVEHQKRKVEASRDEAKRHLELVFGVVADIDYRKVRDNQGSLTDELAARLVKAADQLGAHASADPLELASLQNRIGRTLLTLGHPREAIPLFQKARATWSKQLGPEHLDTLRSMGNLATGYQATARLDLALPLLEETLKLMKAKLGPDDVHTLGSMNNLALIYWRTGKLNLALPLMQEALEVRKTKFGPDHPDTFTSMISLAIGYDEQGKVGPAILLLEEARKLMTVKLGRDHPDTLICLNNLAETYRKDGRLELALPLYKETLELRRSKLGADHPDTLTSMSNLAEGYRHAGELDAALSAYEESFKRWKARLGAGDPHTLTVMNKLAIVYCEAGLGPKAVPLFGAYLEDRQQRLNPRDGKSLAHFMETLVTTAEKLVEAGELAAAEIHLRESYRLFERSKGWLMFYAQSLLGGVLADQKKFVEAEPFLVRGYAGLKGLALAFSSSGKGNLADASARIVRLYEASGRTDEASKWTKILAEHRRYEGKLLETIHDVDQELKLTGTLDAETPGLIYQVRLTAGFTYIADMKSPDGKALDPYLFLRDDKDRTLAQDDDSGGGLNARIIYRPRVSGTYHLRATSFNNGRGEFQLTVRSRK